MTNPPRYPWTTDKVGHGYIPTYLDLAAQINEECQRENRFPSILELGVATGESLTMWSELFPGAILVGVDANPNAVWTFGDRVVARQEDPALANLHLDHGTGGWDLVVDDASHQDGPTRDALMHIWPAVRVGGWYVIEDWTHHGTTLTSLAHDIVSCFDETYRANYGVMANIETALFRPGMIILKKASWGLRGH